MTPISHTPRGSTRGRNSLAIAALVVLAAALAGLAWSAGSRAEPSQPAAGPAPAPATLVVFAAASLHESLAEIGERFEEKNPGVHVELNLAGSQQLAQQLAHGAPADVLATANHKTMDVSVGSGRVAAGSPTGLVRNRLVVIYPAGNPAGIHELADLARPGVRLVLADGRVPAGQYSLDLLDRAARDPALGPAFRRGVLANVVSYEHTVRAVLVKVALGEGDAGVVYHSDLAAGQADRLGTIEIPPALGPVAEYWIAPLADSRRHALAEAFVRLAVSAEGQGILASYGFQPLDETAAP